jgi:phosphatidylcholine synthase
MTDRSKAFLAHAYTISGLATGVFAYLAIREGLFRNAFLWLALSVIIDATDGPLARKMRTASVLPGFDGRKLDDIVDYFNYVIVPALFFLHAHLLPSPLYILVPLISSAYGFCRKNAKTDDGFFTGFPSYWNIVALYLYLFRLSATLNLLIVAFFALLIFIPLKYIDPFKTVPLRRLTAPVTLIWAALCAIIIVRLPNPAPLLVGISFVYPCYYLISSFFLNATLKA